jgi:ABC-type transport system involved in multi-copper enzyme maturation permease subunit
MSALIASEWTKLRSIRSTYWSVLAACVVTVGMATLITVGLGTGNVEVTDEVFDAAGLSLLGVWFGQIPFAVIGVIAVTSEYSTGAIRTSLAAVPRRGQLLAAKLASVGVVVAVSGVLVSFAAFAAGQAVLEGQGRAVGLGGPGVLQAILGASAYLVAMAAIGVAVGVLVRHTASAILGVLGLGLVPALFGDMFPDWLRDNVFHYLPGPAGARISSTYPAPVVADYLWLGGWVVALVILAYWVLRQRDA